MREYADLREACSRTPYAPADHHWCVKRTLRKYYRCVKRALRIPVGRAVRTAQILNV